MLRGGLTLMLGILVVLAKAQDSDRFIVQNQSDFDRVEFSLKTTKVNCFIVPSSNDDIVDLSSPNHDPASQFNQKTADGVKMVNVVLGERQLNYLSSTISNKIFNDVGDAGDYDCKVSFSKAKPLNLSLNYAVGSANINLSGLPIGRLKVDTGSADVSINYDNAMPNAISMDTMLIKVDWGTITTSNLYLSKAKHIVAGIGFGSMTMDFRNAQNYHGNINASVGAGKLEVLLPDHELPILIHLNDSPLCHVAIPDSFRKQGANTYASANYKSDNENTLTFNLDVALGKIIFVANP